MGWVMEEVERVRRLRDMEAQRAKLQAQKDEIARAKIQELWTHLTQAITADVNELQAILPKAGVAVESNQDALFVRSPDHSVLLNVALDRTDLTLRYSGLAEGLFRVGVSEWNEPQLFTEQHASLPLQKASEAMLRPLIQLFA
jgi:hypothetical protein